MAKKSWTIVASDNDQHVEDLTIRKSDVGAAPDGFSITKRTRKVGLSQGVDEIEVHNGKFGFSVLPTRGMGLWKAWLGALQLGWKSPVRGPVHPKFVPLSEPSGLGWLDGFDELMCRCGAESNGAPDFDDQGRLTYPLHGRLANRPAHQVEISIDDDEITIKGRVEETRFHFAKLRLTTLIKTRFNKPGLTIHDTVANLSGSQGEMQMLYHTNLGVPLLEAGAELIVPAETIVPRNDWAAKGIGHWSTYSEPKAGMPERVYFFKLFADSKGQTQSLLKNAAGNKGVSLYWNVNQLPCFTQWKNETAISDGYVTGIEPGTNFPNPRTYESEQGRVIKIPANGEYEMMLGITAHGSAAAVQQSEAEITKLGAGRDPKIFETPQPGWCEGT